MSGAQGRVHAGHAGRIFWCALCPEDEQVVATACEDGTVAVWKDERGSKPLRFVAHDEEVLRLLWNNSENDLGADRVLFSAGSDGHVKAWSVERDGKRASQTAVVDCCSGADEGQIYALLALENDAALVAAHDDAVTLLDKASMRELLTWRYHAVGQASVGGPRNPDNKSFVFDAATHGDIVYTALSDGTVRARDARCPLRDSAIVHAHGEYVTCCAVSEAGLHVATGSGAGAVCLWDVRTWRSCSAYAAPPQLPGPLFGVGFWPGADPALLYAWGSAGKVHFMREGHRAAIDADFRGQAAAAHYPVYCVRATRDGARMAVCGGNAPELKKPIGGLRPTPSAAEGCVRVGGPKQPRLNPWFSLDIAPGAVDALLVGASSAGCESLQASGRGTQTA